MSVQLIRQFVLAFIVTASTCIGVNQIANATAENNAAEYIQGIKYIHAAEYEKARESFKKAWKAHPGNKEYKRNYARINNVIRKQEMLEKETDPARWMKLANSLRIFYTNVGHADQLLAICYEMHKRDNTPTTTSVLSQALIKVGRYSEAEQMLKTVAPAERSRVSHVLEGLVVTHLGRISEGQAILDVQANNEQVSMGVLFRIARLQALLGHHKDAVESIATIYKSAPQKSHAGLTRVVNKTTEFLPLLSDPAFMDALATKSEVPVKKKDDCATCPNRLKCKEREAKEHCEDDGDCGGKCKDEKCDDRKHEDGKCDTGKHKADACDGGRCDDDEKCDDGTRDGGKCNR